MVTETARPQPGGRVAAGPVLFAKVAARISAAEDVRREPAHQERALARRRDEGFPGVTVERPAIAQRVHA